MRRTLLSLSLAAGLLGACNRPYFVWSPREPLASRRGHVALSVDDRRPGDHAIVGRAFGVGGIPEDVRVPEWEAHERLSRLLTEATLTAGIGIEARAEAPNARVSLSLEEMTCHGETLQARAEMRVIFAVSDAAGTPRVAPETIALAGKARGCKLAYYELFDRLLDEVASRLVDGPVHDAVIAEPAPPPPLEVSSLRPLGKPIAVAAARPR